MCKDCETYQIQIVNLKARVKALELIVQDLGGVRVDDDDPYEDERPLIFEKEIGG